jgi:hypothetical protein
MDEDVEAQATSPASTPPSKEPPATPPDLTL